MAYFQQALAATRAVGEPALTAVTLNRIGNWYANQDRPENAGPYPPLVAAKCPGFSQDRGSASGSCIRLAPAPGLC
jgi:hypothetical protein